MVTDVQKVQVRASNQDVRENNELPYALQGSLPVCSEGSFLCVSPWNQAHILNTCSIAVAPAKRCLEHVYFTLAKGFSNEFIATWTTR